MKTHNLKIKERTLYQKIVNVFISIFIAFLFLLFLFFGISQTSTFREYLRNTIVEKVNNSINGRLTIDKVDGTILTSLYLRNTVLASRRDTLLKAETIELKTSPLRLLFKELFVRKIELINANIELISYNAGQTNLDNIFKSQDTVINEGGKPFPFILTVSDAALNNVNFYLHDENFNNTNINYDSLTTQNLLIKNIDASLSAKLDINKNNYDVRINSFSCKSNIKNYNIKNIVTHITLLNDKLTINNLHLLTSNSNINLTGEMVKKELLTSLGNGKIGEASVKLNINSDELDLNEIGKLIPSILPFDGMVGIKLNTQGLFKNLNVDILDILIGNTNLHITGTVKNLDNTDSLDITALINESTLNVNEISQNLLFLNLPEYKDLGSLKIDTLNFRGKEFGFISNFNISNGDGKIYGNVQMNFLSGQNNYFGEINTENLSMLPILDIPLELNSKINIFGSGLNFATMNSNIKIDANNSVYNSKNFNEFNLTSNIQNGKVDYIINATSDLSVINAEGNITKGEDDKLVVDINTKVKKFNTFDFSNDSSLVTDLNLSLIAKYVKAKNGDFNVSSTLNLENSLINLTPLYTNNYKLNLAGNKDYLTNLNLKSDQLEAYAKGKFTIDNTVSLIKKEINSLDKIVKKEIKKLNFSHDSLFTETNEIIKKDNLNQFENEALDFSFKFNEFNLESPFKGSDNINISGFLKGSINNNNDTLSIAFNSNLDYVKIWGDMGVYFLSDLSMDVNLLNDLKLTTFTSLKADINLNTKRIFTGSDIKNIKLNYKISGGKGTLSFNSEIENKFKINLTGSTLYNDKYSAIALDKLIVNFKNYLVKNEGNINIEYSKNNINFRNFILKHNKGELRIEGVLSKKDNHQLIVNLSNVNLDEITQNILNEEEYKNIKGVIGLVAKIGGNYSSPKIGLNLDINQIAIDNYSVGLLKSSVDYLNKNVNLNLAIADSKQKFSTPLLSIKGNLPVDLTLDNINDRFIENAFADIKFIANNFNLLTVSNIIPEFTNITGLLSADLKIKGKVNNLLPTGTASVKNISFISDYNNLKYNAKFKLSAENGIINLDSLILSNVEGTRGGGMLAGTGTTKLDHYKLKLPKVYLNGQLKVLSDDSKSVSPLVYGDLVVATQGQAELLFDPDKEYLKAPLLVKRADLTFPQAKPSFKNTRRNFIYKYVTDTLNVDTDISSFDNLIKLSQQREASNNNVKEETDNIVFDIDVNVEDEASIKFVLDKEFNQVLNTNISGSFQYKTLEGIPRAFGTLSLREGSTLDFLTKSFEAGGTLRFENELTNPYLDVVGIYRDYYYEPTIDSTNATSQEKEVAVKVKLIGPLQDLNKNFVKTKDNLAVYYGTENIDKDIPDLTKDASDAIMFILTGNFSTTEEGFTNNQKSNALTGTASSIAGSLIGGLLNSYAGDYIRSVELKQVGSYTKFSLSGKVNKFKYTIGGTTEVFQDLSRTNIRIEYPFFQKFFIRVERKESLTESNLLREMINELGLKYKFEF